jgi:D-sedoheptulose 7-phosphate isomerase
MDYNKIIEEWKQIAEDFFAAKGELFQKAAEVMSQSLSEGHKILIFGNGGSASQAQHFAAELVNRFLKERAALRAVALSTDTSALTSIANDKSFDYVFSRQLEALGDRGDVAVGLSTSGSSPNVVEALKAAKKKELITVALTGKGGKVGPFADYLLDVPSKSVPRIQEVHLLLLHLFAYEIENRVS